MNLVPLRRLQSLFSAVFLAAGTLFLASCGGGGASSPPTAAGELQLLPGAGSLYAGVPYTFNIVGGRRPYLVTSSELTLVNVNMTIDGNTFTVIANNPGVIDANLQPGEVPRRSFNIEVRDGNGATTSNEFSVIQNFVTGYSVSYGNTCTAPATGAPPDGCSGTDSIVLLDPIFNGVLFGNREFQFDKVRGDFQFVPEPPGINPQLVNTLRVRTDHQGFATARIRVAVGAPTQLATYKVTDITTGATSEFVFLILQQAPSGVITVLPGSAITFTGPSAGACGFGSSDQYVFDGTPPYTITPPAGVSVTPLILTENGSRFTITVGQGFPVTACPSGSVIVRDSQGRITSVSVTSVPGTSSIPITIAPSPLQTLTCAANTTQAAVVGGVAQLQVVSTHPRVQATISGNVLSVLRIGSGDGAIIYPTTATLVITDGASVLSVNVTVPANCP